MNDWPSDPVSALVDLASQVQVETSQHAQRRGLLIRGADGSQGVRHAPGRAGDERVSGCLCEGCDLSLEEMRL